MGLGWVRAKTSLGSSCNTTNGNLELMSVIRLESKTASTAPRNKAVAEFRTRNESPVIDDMPIPMIGDMSGATNMAPMMTAGESVTNPSVAILQDNTTNRKKSKLEVADWRISCVTTIFSSAVNG